jgi:PhnB protein
MHPYLHFQGTCAEAMRFYAEVFGATDLQMMDYADTPAEAGMPKMPGGRVMHSQMTTPGGVLMASDYPPGQDGAPQGSVSLMLAPKTVAEGRRLFDSLKGGAVVVDYGPTFFSKGFGMMVDQFGTHWIVGAAGD